MGQVLPHTYVRRTAKRDRGRPVTCGQCDARTRPKAHDSNPQLSADGAN